MTRIASYLPVDQNKGVEGIARRAWQDSVLGFCSAIAARKAIFSTTKLQSGQPDDQMFGRFCQYLTGAKQFIGALVVVLVICRGGKKGVAGSFTLAEWREENRARRWQERGPAEGTRGPFLMHISNKHGDKTQQQASTYPVRSND
jgi:hypothetical protein